jgi:hypothetical protein
MQGTREKKIREAIYKEKPSRITADFFIDTLKTQDSAPSGFGNRVGTAIAGSHYVALTGMLSTLIAIGVTLP